MGMEYTVLWKNIWEQNSGWVHRAKVQLLRVKGRPEARAATPKKESLLSPPPHVPTWEMEPGILGNPISECQ